MQTSRLFTLLPEEYVCTPDGMEIDKDGNLIVSCPNYADDNMSGCVIRIDKDKNISKWFDVPVHPQTGIARKWVSHLTRNGICTSATTRHGQEKKNWHGRAVCSK